MLNNMQSHVEMFPNVNIISWTTQDKVQDEHTEESG